MGRRVLLTSARSLGGWNGPAELPFRIRRRSLGLYLLAENVGAAVLVAERCEREAFARLLARERFHVVGIGFTAPEVGRARDLARLVRLVLPSAHIVLGGPGAQAPGVPMLVDCDTLAGDDGVAAVRRVLGEDPEAPVRLPALSGAARLTAAGRTELAMLLCGVGGAVRRPLFDGGEALFAEACRVGAEVGTESFYVPDEEFLASPSLVRGLLAAMEREHRAFEFAVHARASDVAAWAPEELSRLGVFGVLLAAQRWTGEEAALVRRLHQHGIAVHAPVLVGPETTSQEIDAALALGADSVEFLPRYALPEAAKGEEGMDRLLESCEAELPASLSGALARARLQARETLGPPPLRLARTLLEGYRAHEFSDDPWMRRRMEQARCRAEDLRVLMASPTPAAATGAELALRRELERDYALLLGPDTLSSRAMALGSQALQEFGTVLRRVRRAMDASGTQMRHYRWREAVDKRGRETARRVRRFTLLP